jgi:hypothetical protein
VVLPAAGECDIVQPSRAEMLRSCLTLWGVEGACRPCFVSGTRDNWEAVTRVLWAFPACLLQVRCLKLEGPFRQQFFWSGVTDDVMDFRIFVLDTELPGTCPVIWGGRSLPRDWIEFTFRPQALRSSRW